MLLCAALLLAQTPIDRMVADIDALAKAKDIDGLTKYLAPFKGQNPLSPIRSGGTYGTGRYGWRALLLRMGVQSFVVFTTPLTSEDVGELLFRLDEQGKLVYVPEDFNNGERIASHRLSVSFDLPRKQANIKDTVRIENVGQRTQPPILRLGPNYRVRAVHDANGQPIAFLQAGGIVCFPGLGVNETLTLDYIGTLDKAGYAGSISDKEVMLTNDYWYPMIARQPAPYTLTVTTPGSWIPVGQGEIVSQQTTGPKKTTTFRMDLPVTYYSFSASEYRTSHQSIGGRKFSVWAHDLSSDQMALQHELYAPILKFYERFASYPFSQWGAVVSQIYGGGALEAYSFATYGGGFPGEDAHETAHTWWGGMVDNTYLHSLWNESFAVFCEGYYARNVPIGNVDDRRLAFISTPETSPAFNAAPPSQASPFIGPAASSIGYGKGAYVLQMLEQEIGSEDMLKSMQEWQRAQPKTRGGEWEDFEAAVARAHREDVHWFFNQWVNRAGFAIFSVPELTWANGRLLGRIRFQGEPYIIHADVLIRDASGDRFIKGALSQNVREAEQRFILPCPNKPLLVSIDPWRRILRPIGADETPSQISTTLYKLKRFTDPRHPGYLRGMGAGGTLESAPSDAAGAFIVGHPDSLPLLGPLCKKVGFQVKGEELTYRGTTVDLRKGAALAVVDLGNGKQCAIGLGTTRRPPNVGRARVAVVDEYGRFLRGETEPKTRGPLTFRDF